MGSTVSGLLVFVISIASIIIAFHQRCKNNKLYVYTSHAHLMQFIRTSELIMSCVAKCSSVCCSILANEYCA